MIFNNINILKSIRLDFLPDDAQGIYLVGGTVRDLMMGLAPSDIDLAIHGDVTRVADHIVRKTGGRPVHLGRKDSVVCRIVLPDMTIDLTPLAGENINADLRMRDFTINAMAYDVAGKRLVDCTGGLADIRRKTVRLVSPSAFDRDPVRLVRAYRFAAVFGFSIAEETRQVILRDRHRVASVAGERIWSELNKILHIRHASSIVQQMAASGLLSEIIPEMKPTVGCVQNAYHQFDVFSHSLLAAKHLESLLAEVEKRVPEPSAVTRVTDLADCAYLMKYAALLHDIGKPDTRQVGPDGRVRFPGHAARSADIAMTVSRRLRLSGRERMTTDIIIRHHIRPLFLFLAVKNGNLGRRGMIRFFSHCGRLALPIIIHTMADILAKAAQLDRRGADFIDFCQRLMQEYDDYRRRGMASAPLIDGHDLIRVFGLPPSPMFKRILSRLDEERLAGTLTSRDDALAWVRLWLATHGHDAGA